MNVRVFEEQLNTENSNEINEKYVLFYKNVIEIM